VSNLIDIDLQGYEPAEDPDEPEEAAEAPRSAGSAGKASGLEEVRPRSAVKLPHPPGPAGLTVPRTRLWIKRPPGPAGL
jgi:hypothetical protein